MNQPRMLSVLSLGLLCWVLCGSSSYAKSYAIVVGCADYPGTQYDLPGVLGDVDNMATVLSSIYSIPSENVFKFKDTVTDGDQFEAQITNLVSRYDATMLVIYYSGHGNRIGNNSYLDLPDGTLFDYELEALVDQCDVQVVIIADSCHAGGFAANVGAPQRLVMTASSLDRSAIAFQNSSWFTKSLCDGFAWHNNQYSSWASYFMNWTMWGWLVPDTADDNLDGKVVFSEGFDYADDNLGNWFNWFLGLQDSDPQISGDNRGLYFDQKYDNTPPRVLSRRYSTDRATSIYVTFSERMDDTTITSSRCTASGSSSGGHTVSVSYNRTSKELTIDPTTDFTYGETVTVTLSDLIKDIAQNRLDGDSDGDEGPAYSFSFTIQNQPTTPPTSIGVTANSTPSSIQPYDTVTISGSATYNNGVPVNGTATINTGASTYTTPVVGGSYSRAVVGPGSSRNVTVSVSDGSLTGNGSVYVTVSGEGGTPQYDLETHIVWKVEDEGNGYCSYWSKDTFRTTDTEVNLLALIDNASLNSDLDFSLKFYYPSGTQYGNTLSEDNAFDRDWEWGYWWWGYLIAGNSMAETPGKYKVKFYVDGDRKATEYYVVAWDFVNHYTCDNNNDENPIPSGGKTTFLTTDPQVMALHHFEKRAQGMMVKTEFYAPDGHKEVEGEYTFADDLGSDEWWDDSWHWQTMPIAGTPRVYMCGNWTVKFYVKNPVTGGWEQKYTDYFRIQESTSPSVSVSVSPASPIETQAIALNISASDNNHLKKVTVHWNDGTWHENSWDNINASSWNGSQSVGSSAPAGQTVEFWCETWDESGNRAESSRQFVTIQSETVSVPLMPSGPSIAYVGTPASYNASGSSSSLGSPVNYQYAWGDGQTSGWGAASVPHTWAAEGSFSVITRACSQPRPSNMSGWSVPKTVQVRDWNKDYDGDGMTDAEEAIAGTDPSAGASLLSVADFVPESANGRFIISWPSASNRFYHLKESHDLAAGFGGYTTSNLTATPPMNTYTADMMHTPAFFRVHVTTNRLGQ